MGGVPIGRPASAAGPGRLRGPGLTLLYEGDPMLRNLYSVIRVNPDKYPHVRREAAEQFADFLTGPGGRKVIAEFGKERFGQPLFFLPDAAGE